MSSFEYVMVIVSIIMGLGITSLLRGTVNMLRADTAWKPGLLHSLWVINLLIMHVGLWSLRWAGEPREEWPFVVLLAFLLLPVLYYALAELLFPGSADESSLSEYFLSNRRLFFGVQILIVLGATFGPFIFYGGVNPLQRNSFEQSPLGISLYLLVSIATYSLLAYSANRRLHVIFASFFLATLFWQFGLLDVG